MQLVNQQYLSVVLAQKPLAHEAYCTGTVVAHEQICWSQILLA